MTTKKNDVLGFLDLADRWDSLLDEAAQIKRRLGSGGRLDVATGRQLGLLFETPSTRARVSMQIGFQRLGGSTLDLDPNSLQASQGETLRDTAVTLSQYLDAIVYRAIDHRSVKSFAKHATVPVINGMDDREDPLQALADLLTLREHFRHLRGLDVAFLGDGSSSYARSLMFAAPTAGLSVRFVCPDGYRPERDALRQAEDIASERGTSIKVLEANPKALEEVDVVATTAWVPPGQEDEKKARLEALKWYGVTPEVMATAPSHAVFLHPLPAHGGQETTEDVVHGPQSLVFESVQNRLWTQMALLQDLLTLKPMGNGVAGRIAQAREQSAQTSK